MTRISQQKCQDIPEYIAIGQKGDIMTEKLKNYKHGCYSSIIIGNSNWC